MTSDPPEPLFDVLPANSTEDAQWSLHARMLERFDTKEEALKAAWDATEAYYCHVIRTRAPIVPVVFQPVVEPPDGDER